MIVTSENLNEIARTTEKETVINWLKEMDESARLELSGKVVNLIWAYLGCFNGLAYYTWSELSINAYSHYQLVNLDNRPFSRKELENGLEVLKIVLVFCTEPKAIFEIIEYFPADARLSADILQTRKLKNLMGMCKSLIKQGHPRGTALVRELERRGTVKLSRDSNYFQALAKYISASKDPVKAICAGAMETNDFAEFLFDPKALRIFVESNSIELVTSRIDELVDSDYISSESISALSMELLARKAETWVKADRGWEHKSSLFAVALNNAVVKDKQANADTYIALCGVRNSFVSSYIIDLLLCEKVISSDNVALISNLSGNFASKDKEPALLTVQLLNSLHKQGKISSAVFVEKLTDALWHKSQDVHDLVLKTLEKSDLCRVAEEAVFLSDSMHLLKSANKLRAKKLLARHQVPLAEDKVVPFASISLPEMSNGELDSALGLVKIREAIESIEKGEWSKIDQILQSLLSPVNFRKVPAYWASVREEQLLEKDQSLEELAHLFKLAISNQISNYGLESLLENLALNWSKQNENFQDIRQLFKDCNIDAGQSMFSSSSFSMVGVLAQTWLEAGSEITAKVYYPRLISERILGLVCRMSDNLRLPMLASPTHRGYRIAPIVFVERVLEYQDKGRLLIDKVADKGPGDIFRLQELFEFYQQYDYAADVTEFLLGLLRLAIVPDFSTDVVVDGSAPRQSLLNQVSAIFRPAEKTDDKTLQLARSVKGDFGRALRYVLGEGELASIKNWELAVTAFRARYPLGVLQGFSTPVMSHPDVASPAKYRFTGDKLPGFPDVAQLMRWHSLVEFFSAREPGVNHPEITVEQPRNFIVEKRLQWSFETAPLLRCPAAVPHLFYLDTFAPGLELFSLWPNNQEAALARLARIVFGAINTTSNCWHNDFEPVFEEDVFINENGAWLIAAGSFSACTSLRSTIQDLLIDAINTSRCHVESLSEAFHSMLRFKLVIKRMSDMFKQTARVSDLHALFIWQLASELLCRVEPASRQFDSLLEVLLEIQEEFKFVLSDKLKELLAPIKGSNNRAKIASALRESKLDWSECASLPRACQQSIDARLKREERWMNSFSDR